MNFDISDGDYMNFDISDGLKNHYLCEYPIKQLIETFILVFKKEKEELIRQYVNGLETIYGEPSFSPTVRNISDMIVYKYFNDGLSVVDSCYVTSNNFREYPFRTKILDLIELEFDASRP